MRTLPLVVLALALVAPACGDDDDTSASGDAGGVSDETGDDSVDGGNATGDCAALQSSIEIVGLNWSYLQAIATSGDPDLFDDIAPGGVLPVDFPALQSGIDDLRVLDADGTAVATALDRLEQTADLAREGIEADEEGRIEVAAELAELTDGGALIITDQVTIGTALAEAGC